MGNIRVRPQSSREIDENCCSIAEVLAGRSVRIKDSEYVFDRAYDVDTAQIQIFNDVGIPLVQRFLNGFNASIFAYGQVFIKFFILLMKIKKSFNLFLTTHKLGIKSIFIYNQIWNLVIAQFGTEIYIQNQ